MGVRCEWNIGYSFPNSLFSRLKPSSLSGQHRFRQTGANLNSAWFDTHFWRAKLSHINATKARNIPGRYEADFLTNSRVNTWAGNNGMDVWKAEEFNKKTMHERRFIVGNNRRLGLKPFNIFTAVSFFWRNCQLIRVYRVSKKYSILALIS